MVLFPAAPLIKLSEDAITVCIFLPIALLYSICGLPSCGIWVFFKDPEFFCDNEEL